MKTWEEFEDALCPEPNTGCWLWTRRLRHDGYGELCWRGGHVTAHRVAWLMRFKFLPPGAHVLHKCDTPACCNPGHLFLGTQRSNVADMVRKKRHQRGERNGMAHLSDAAVEAIRTEYNAGGITQAALAKRFGVTPGHVSAIVNGKKRKQPAN